MKSSGDAIGSLMSGLPTTFVQSTAAKENFVEDPFRHLDARTIGASPAVFTIDMGLRWEPYLPPTDTDGWLAGFEPGVQSTLAPHVPQRTGFLRRPWSSRVDYSRLLEQLLAARRLRLGRDGRF